MKKETGRALVATLIAGMMPLTACEPSKKSNAPNTNSTVAWCFDRPCDQTAAPTGASPAPSPRDAVNIIPNVPIPAADAQPVAGVPGAFECHDRYVGPGLTIAYNADRKVVVQFSVAIYCDTPAVMPEIQFTYLALYQGPSQVPIRQITYKDLPGPAPFAPTVYTLSAICFPGDWRAKYTLWGTASDGRLFGPYEPIEGHLRVTSCTVR